MRQESEAQKQLRRMLTSFTPGSILHLLAEAFRAHAEQSKRPGRGRPAHRPTMSILPTRVPLFVVRPRPRQCRLPSRLGMIRAEL